MKRTCLFIFFLLRFFAVSAQGDYMFFHLFLDKGLSDAHINSIVQDKYGFMWFGTPNGLNRYDGYSMRTFYTDKAGSLPSNNIRTLYSDSKGLLWVGTTRGIAWYNFVTERFEHTGAGEGLATASVFCFTEDSEGNVYTGTSDGLFCWNRKNRTWKNLSAAYHLPQRLVLIKGLLFLNKDILFASTEKKSFYKINIATGKLDTFGFKIGNVEECCLSMYGMEKLNDNEILVGTLSFGLIKFNIQKGTFSWPRGELQKKKNILFNTVTQIRKDHVGRFWVASSYFRLAEYLPGSDSVTTIRQAPYNPYGFGGSSASCVYEDRQGNIWIGTGTDGIYHFNPNRKRVRFYSGNDFENGALQRGKVLSIAPLDSNSLMIGTSSGPSIFYRNTQTFLNFKGYSYNFGNKALEQVTAGLKDKNGIVWMGSIRLGLMRYDPGSKKIDVFGRFTAPIPFRDDGVTDILEMDGDSLLVIGYNRVAVFHTKKFTSRSFNSDTITPLYRLSRVVDLSYDRHHKNIWVAVASANLYEYDPASKSLTDRSALLNTRRPSVLYKIAFDETGNLWCATDLGAICIEKGKPARIYSLNEGKNASAEVKNILPVGKDIWLTNDRSIGKLDPITGKILLLGEKDGFGGIQLFSHSLALSPWNTVLIGSNKGFYEIFPDMIRDDHTSSSAFLTAFRVYGQLLSTKEVVSTIKELNLSHSQRFFSFDMSAFDYSEANDLEYAYKLEGFDRDWVYAGKQRSGSYTNVPGGDYILKLKARNGSGAWNEAGQKIHIHIAKPFWEMWWFIVLMILLVAAVVYLIYLNRIRSIRRQSKLRSDYEIKLNELENSALRTQMNPHFIFNSLNTINSFINRNEPARANQYISKFSRLIRHILDHSREKKITLADELEVVGLYVELERIRFDNKFNCKVSVENTIDPDSTEIPPLIIQPFVENAILHGLLPLEAGGNLQINVTRVPESLLLIVEDNGVGRAKAKEYKLPAKEKHKSHGIEITLKRIELFNKEHRFDGVVNIVDLLDELGKPAGTRVEIPIAWEQSF
jgi:ligand-binding sensor domain-containing protein